ncbi:MAG: DNA repair protein RecO [Gemmatimonadota bacterium]
METPAILLRVVPYQESSAILRFLTRDHGALSVMGRGVRSGGKGKGVPGLFASGSLQLQLRPQRDLQNLGSFRPHRSGLALARDLRTLGAASVLAEVVLLNPGEEADPPLFQLLLGALEALESSPGSQAPWILLGAGWVLMHHLGFSPEVERCVRCQQSLPDTEILRFHVEAGGVMCSACQGSSPSTGVGPRVGPGAREQLASLVSGRPLSEEEGLPAHLKLLRTFMEFHLGARKPLASFDFLLGS